MTQTGLAVALSMIAATSPVWATSLDPAATAGAPIESPDTRYCMRVEANTGTRIETVECWTRQEWAEFGGNLDRDWAREGVGIIRPGAGFVRVSG